VRRKWAEGYTYGRNAYKIVEVKQECCDLYERHKWDDSTKLNIKGVCFEGF
jgi:hypothetical protein